MAKNIKEVQEINRMILDEVDRVCKKYNICYYLDCDVGDILKFDGNLEEEDDHET